MSSKSEFMKIMRERGFLHQCTDETGLDEKLSAGKTTGYIGFDCTAPSLHVGNLMQIMVLRWLKNTGHEPIILFGGATTKIGDPSGKDESRPPMVDTMIEINKAGIKKNFEQFGLGAATFVDNSEWLDNLNYIKLLRDVGPHFSINRMITQDSVKLRLEREQNLSFLEFNYMILQSYDFVELHKKYNCILQIGGSDQWGNIIMGIDLKRRLDNRRLLLAHALMNTNKDYSINWSTYKEPNDSLFGLTTPLITTFDGKKMGKTAAGAVWLNPDMLSPYDYWQFWRNTTDADVGRFLRLFTELPIAEIERLEKLQDAEINEAKKILATEATALCHGSQAAEEAKATAQKTFEEGRIGEALPVIEIKKSELENGIPAFSLFHNCGLAASGSEAKKLIRGKGAKLNDAVIENESRLVTLADLNADGVIKLSAGKKRHIIVRVV